MKFSEHDRTELQLLEEGLWRTETRFDRGWMERVLAPRFFEFGRSGRIYNREETLGMVARPIDARLEDVSVRLLSADVAQVTYTSIETYAGEEQVAHRSSFWLRSEDGWQLLFHQATTVA